jgi:long-subunit fatty acid transport protein
LDEPAEIPEIYVKTGFEDAWSVRLGATRAFEELGARLYLGSFYETGASSELGITPASMDLDKVGLSAGWHQVIGADVSLDFAIAHQEWLTREVTNGEARLIDPLTAEELHPTNNGTFTNRRTLFHAALTWQTS